MTVPRHTTVSLQMELMKEIIIDKEIYWILTTDLID